MMLFAFIFDFLPATLAVGVGAVSIPVIIHLINRRRFKIVPWAAMRFLLAAQKQTRKRMRIEQLLLLLVRMLIVALVIFAMASVMPWAEAIWSSPPAQAIFSFLGLSKTGFGQVARQQRIHHVMVLDASLSMNQVVEGGQTAFERARQLMLKKIQDGQAGDGYSILILKDTPSWLVGQASQNTRKVMEEVEAVKPSHGNSALPVALSMVSGKLQEARGRFPTQAVYFFTDMQQSTWAAAASEVKADADGQEKAPYLDIQDKAKCVFVDCGPLKDAANLAVTDLAFDAPYVTAGTFVPLKATVQNFSTEAKRDLRVELLIGKARENANDAPLQLRVVGQEIVTITAGERRTIDFRDFKFPAPGTYAVQVKIAGDPLEQDDTRTIVITVRKTIPILLVNGKASADRFERATEYLRLALNPFPAGTEPDFAPLRPRVVSPAEFTGMSDADLASYDAIFWCDVGQFGGDDVRKLDAHLRRGGGFFVSLGDNAAKSIDRYNDLLYKKELGLLPARLMKLIQAPPDHHFYFSNSAKDAYDVPPLAAFADDQDRLALRTTRFRQFVQATVPEGKARTILAFMPEVASTVKGKLDAELPINAPALIEWQPPLAVAKVPQAAPVKGQKRVERQPARYRGKVILLTSTVNMDWTSWPGSPSYGAMMHELTRLAVSGRLREQAQTVGVALEDYLPGGAEDEVTVNFPVGMPDAKPAHVRTQLIDEVNLFRFGDTEFSGVYRVETNKGHEIPFAVNVPTAAADQHGTESDLSRYDEAKLKDLYPDWKFQVVRNPLEAQVAGKIDGPDDPQTVETKEPMGPWFANVSLVLLLVLLFTEIVLAWAFGHYTTTEGAIAPKPPGQTSTYVAAGIAIVSTLIFGLGAFIIFRYMQTGDFLGDLPDILRTFFENSIGVEAPQPGEAKNWRYETLPFLFGLPGGEYWWSILLSIAAFVGIFFIYKAEGPRVPLVFKMLLGALRLYLILTALWFLLPRGQIQYARLAYADMALLIDDTRSMGESDTLQDEKVIERVKKLSEGIRQQLQQELPGRINTLENEIRAKAGGAEINPLDAKAEADGLHQRLHYWEKQRDDLNAGKWRPSRLQLVQAILAQPEPHWLKTLLSKYKTKVHIFHLDANGRATKLHDPKGGDAGEVFNEFDARQMKATADAIAALEPVGNESRLGTALRQVMDHYRGSSLSSVIMFTDGVTTRDETIAQASDYAAQKGISLFFVGVGDENDQRKLELSDLQVEDQIYLGDAAVFEARVTGHGFKDLTVPVILKIRDKTGKEREVGREMIKVDPSGKSVKVRLRHQPKEVGSVPYIIEIEPPKLEPNEKPLPPGNLRLERTIEVIDTKLIKVLLVEGQPRYEFRYLKYLMERESPDKKKKKSIELKVLLLDADDDFAATDKTALRNFPPTLKDLNQYDVVILGDCDPTNKKLQNNLKDIASFVRGEDEKGKKGTKPGGGLLFIAGSSFNPHRYKGTPLADVMPVEPLTDKPPVEFAHVDKFKPDLTPAGKNHPIFRFSPDEGENNAIWQRLAPMFWYSTKYRIKPAAEVLAVHAKDKAEFKDNNGDGRHPLVVQQFVGTGRSMFFGFDETWRWRKDDESRFNNFWIQTMRYLSRGRSTRTNLRLDQQTPYQLGKPIKITVQFPDNTPGGANQPGPKVNEKTEVKVTVEYKPTGAKDGPREGAIETITLAKVEGSWGTYEGTMTRTRDGKYRFRLTNPDVSATQPDGEKPSAEAIVVLPPGELDNLRMNYQEMQQAAFKTRGQFHTVASADETLDELPPGDFAVVSTGQPPTMLWNQWWVFAIVLFMITSEWVLRKMRHLL